jgi:hypothetical protein
MDDVGYIALQGRRLINVVGAMWWLQISWGRGSKWVELQVQQIEVLRLGEASREWSCKSEGNLSEDAMNLQVKQIEDQVSEVAKGGNLKM